MLSPSPLRRLSPAVPSLPSFSHHRLYNHKPSPILPCFHSFPKPLLQVRAIDAAQPYDYESRMASRFQKSQKLKIAIIGFGKFGQFLAKTLVRQGHTVLAHSRSDYFDVARKLGVSFFLNADDLAEKHPEVILLCTSIISTESVLRSLPLRRLKRNTLIVDVLSVKEFPKSLMLELLPVDFDIICSHPMFGPESGADGWNDLFFVYEKVRIGSEESRVSRCEKFLSIFEKEGCKMVEMSCADHDVYAAESQFITHTVGRILGELKLESTPINTKGYETILNLVKNTVADSFDLYYGLFVYNKNSLEMMKKLGLAFQELNQELCARLHEVVRKQLFESEEKLHTWPEIPSQNGASLALTTYSEPTRFQDLSPTNGTKPSKPEENPKLKIAIVGFGNFGQFLSKTMVKQGHHVLAYSRSDYSDVAKELGISYFSDIDDLCEEHPEVVLLCTSILSTEKVLRSIPFQRLKRNTLFVDVLSVKEAPRKLFLQILPPEFDILCTHPMFGPESGKNGWNDLSFVYDKVRVGNEESRAYRCNCFLDIFSSEGCRMVEMSCYDHDRHAAGSQFITHTMGRVLEKMKLSSTPVNTQGYNTVLDLVSNTSGDSFDLYYGLFLYNANAMEQLDRLFLAFEAVNKLLFGRLHDVLRKQLFEDKQGNIDAQEDPMMKPYQNSTALLTLPDSRELH
ncbi:arogenate dehydrogenase 1, chloroplastic [Cucumis sativus]|uniref:Prephenate/arogenate dehydrogenase domain-containing protein n=1 Tax=Cucumis sativus TaxID=3659 RepID=A0A0A0LJ16_CUCSA|nr:arogenate dehydrogenase 1, chloroplastic [Cucumis sativus]KGN60722.1 hypothetical protein Csa_019395 [Cucumis sativus]